MYPLLETIRLENGVLENLDFHELRIDRSLSLMYGNREIPPIREMIKLRGDNNTGIFKCRLLYSNKSFKLIFEGYNKRQISQLIVTERPDIKYNLKYSDRRVFENLINTDNKEAEVLITKNNCLTDTSYTNIALKMGRNWITPEYPLLEGTQRALLLKKGVIKTGHIEISDLKKYSRIRLFNAMMPWDDCIELDIDQIKHYD